MIKINDRKKCVSCGACYNICPVNAIKIQEDKYGFRYPYIDKSKCINCNLCDKVCKIGKTYIGKEYYAVINKNNEERKKSASGAVFPLLAKYVLDKNGIVCGVAYDEHMNVTHMFADNMEDAKKFKGSKYVRSETDKIYKEIKKYLKEDRYVLFVGTPCQVSGLKNFLDNDYEKLIVCDLVCHSNPPQKIFSKYIEYLEKIYNKKIIDFSFRDKTISWYGSNCRAFFSDGTSEIVDNIYSKAFLAGGISYEACYDCNYTGIDRVGDISIGDFWGVESLYPEFYDKDGVSIIFVNNDKGKEIFKTISKEMKVQKITKEEILKYNHNSPTKKHSKKDIKTDVVAFSIVCFYTRGGTYARLYKY